MRHASCDQGVSEIIGSLLLVLVTVMLAAGFTLFIVNAQPGPHEQVEIDLALSLDPGPDGCWETGDEAVVVVHGGGERLSEGRTRVHLTIAGVEQTLLPADVDLPKQAIEVLGQVFGGPNPEQIDEETLTIGETWTIGGLTIPEGAEVFLDIVQTGQGTHVVYTAKLRAPTPGGCP